MKLIENFVCPFLQRKTTSNTTERTWTVCASTLLIQNSDSKKFEPNLNAVFSSLHTRTDRLKTLTTEQITTLEREFNVTIHLTIKRREELASELEIGEELVAAWFRNRRQGADPNCLEREKPSNGSLKRDFNRFSREFH